MSDAAAGAGDPAAAPSAGRLLREARERQGLHIAALAASIKVAPKKLEMLEADRFEALPDATFTRALAQTVCRALKIDSAPILRLLPPPQGHRLDQVGEGLNAPFRERPGALVQRDGSSLTLSPVFWITALILIAAIALYFVPSGFIHLPAWRAAGAASAAEPRGVAAELPGMPPESAVASAALAGGAMPASIVPVATPSASATPGASSAPAPTVLAWQSSSAAASASASGAMAGTAVGGDAAVGVLQFRTSAASWLEVTDARGRALVSRLVQPGETIDVDGAAPFRVRIGNASATRVSFRGQPLELAAFTRDNVARLDLK